jgi:beta-galactosidase
MPVAELDPDREEFAHLKYAPFVLNMGKIDDRKIRFGWGDLRIDGFIAGKQVISKTFSGSGVDRKLVLAADDHELVADGADSTRVVVRVTDEFGAVRPLANDPIVFTLEGPARLIGDNPFSLVGGVCAVWVRAGLTPGAVRLTAKHSRLGSQTVSITLKNAEAELV